MISQYFLCEITDSKGMLPQCFVYFGTLFSDSFLECLFLSFSVFFGATFGLLLVPKLGLGVVFDAARNDAKKGFGESPGI